MMLVALLFIIGFSLINARCPNPAELPLKYDSNTFMCARLYEHKDRLDQLSCGGEFLDIYNGQSTTEGTPGWNNRASSLVVRDGCKLRAYEHSPTLGRVKEFEGKVSDLAEENFDDVISNWVCSCKFSNAALSCIPSEEYHEIAVCYNPSQDPGTCEHKLQEGLSIGDSVTQGRSLSDTVEASLGAAFKEIFSLGLSTSRKTEYSWSSSDSCTFGKIREISITCNVSPGQRVRVLQVVGRCADTDVYAPYYLCK